jgi:MtrB/PioB family decaheme-associated outer membrane protein
MTKFKHVPSFGRTLVAVSATLAFGPALAQVQGIAGSQTDTTYLAPENTVSIGAGFSSGDQKDRARFGLFNGLRDHDVNGLLDFNYSNKDASSGKWMTVFGRNLGLDNRELSFGYRNLGDFKLKVDYGEITRHDPRTINTNMTGSGTANLATSTLATPGTGSDLNLELKRKGLGFDLAKQFGDFQVQVTFKNEDKTGARFMGRGLACSAAYVGTGACTNAGTTAVLLTPEPIDSTIRQFEAKLNYSSGNLNLSGGYYGNFYTNNFGSLSTAMTGPFGNNNGGFQAIDPKLNAWFQNSPMALWPDSQAHQFYIGGNYALPYHTKINFKYSYTHATQNEDFGGMGLTGAPAGRSNLGGELNTTKAQLGFSSHPLDKLHVHGDVAYNATDNKTPIALYNANVAAPNVWTNSAMSPSKFDAKLEANYRLPYELLLVGGLKYERENTGAWTPTDAAGGITALRQKTENMGYRVEVRKTMSETFTGSIAYDTERRQGDSSWLRVLALPLTGVLPASADCPTGPNVTSFAVANAACVYNVNGQIPFTQKDKQTQKIRATGVWTPMERLSLQAFVDTGKDDYRGPTTTGLTGAKLNNYTLDASYDISDNWKVNGYFTQADRSLDTGHSTDYNLTLKDKSTTFGMGFSGRPAANFRIGGDLIYLRDTLHYNISPEVGISVANQTLLNATGGLPDVKYNLTQVKLYGEYEFTKVSSVRVDYIYSKTYFNEWTYSNPANGVPFLFSDNTTVTAQQSQSVNYLGAMYVYKFR